ncbi:uncharacterized protein [Diadema setosum]|uniref:uncharacterized protein n=1 Tax=Diadema setosum TaxID=31175 RepID=UPI003B3A95EF
MQRQREERGMVNALGRTDVFEGASAGAKDVGCMDIDRGRVNGGEDDWNSARGKSRGEPTLRDVMLRLNEIEGKVDRIFEILTKLHPTVSQEQHNGPSQEQHNGPTPALQAVRTSY